MSENMPKDYALSTEELAMAFSLINRPDLGKAVLFETFGDQPQGISDERLRAASHSLLARRYASIGANGIAMISEDLQSTLLLLCVFKGMIQTVITETESTIINSHIGLRGNFTSHWVEQGVIHRIVSGSLEQLPEMIASFVSMPETIPAPLSSAIKSGNYEIHMETFAELPRTSPEDELEAFVKEGLTPPLAEALLADLRSPLKRGSVSYIPVDSKNIDKHDTEQAVAGLFFLTGKNGWILAFPKKEKDQTGRLIPGTQANLKKKIKELQDQKSKAFL